MSAIKNILQSLAIGLLIIHSTQSCKKAAHTESFPEPEKLGCSNLLIRSVALVDTLIEVTVENTCKTCKEYRSFLGMTMLNRVNPFDTLAWDCGNCITCPNNGETKTYRLNTKLERLPALGRVLFDFGALCSDLIYLPK